MGEALSVLGKAFFASDALGKAIVLLLVVASLWSWSIILLKWTNMVKVRRGCRRFMRSYQNSSPLKMGVSLSEDDEMPLDCVCRAGIESLKEVLARSELRGSYSVLEMYFKLPRALTSAEVEKIRSSMVRAMNIQRIRLEDMMVTLSTIVTLAPFAGLLGTVWGVMMVFFQMGMTKRPEISDMAPGVSSALLTTVIGLLVAIPAVVGNNMITGDIDRTCDQMEIFVDDFLASLQLEENLYRPPAMEGGMTPPANA